MNKKKLTKRELRERQVFEDKKFNKTLLISFSSLFVFVIFYLVFHTFWHDTKYIYGQYALYGKPIPAELVCMNGNKLLNHTGKKLLYKGKTYFFCTRNATTILLITFKKMLLPRIHFREIQFVKQML